MSDRANSRITVRRLLIMALACLAWVSMEQAVSAESDHAGGDAPSFSQDIQPIFDSNCVVCHQSGGASGGLSLEDGEAYSLIVSYKSQESALFRIAPGEPEASYLIRKLEGTHGPAGGSGERMPPTGPLDSALIGTIRNWVKAGAKND